MCVSGVLLGRLRRETKRQSRVFLELPPFSQRPRESGWFGSFAERMGGEPFESCPSFSTAFRTLFTPLKHDFDRPRYWRSKVNQRQSPKHSASFARNKRGPRLHKHFSIGEQQAVAQAAMLVSGVVKLATPL